MIDQYPDPPSSGNYKPTSGEVTITMVDNGFVVRAFVTVENGRYESTNRQTFVAKHISKAFSLAKGALTVQHVEMPEGTEDD